MHDGAFTGVSLIDNVGNASDIVGGAKGTVYNIAGFMMNMIKKANVKDKNRVRERFILHNTKCLWPKQTMIADLLLLVWWTIASTKQVHLSDRG
jgi:hypothetical protein